MALRLRVTSAINTSTGFSVTNACGEVVNRQINQTTGVFKNDTYWSKSRADELAGFDKFVPVIITDDVISERIGAVEVTLTQQEMAGANLMTTVLTKVAAKLNEDYGWTVVVENV